MDWTNSQVLHFIKLYEKYALLWNTKHPDHKNRKRMGQAWLKIRDELGMDLDVADIKRKKESILATYRSTKKKVLSSKQSGNKTDVYKPTWFAYNSLDRFLKDKTSLMIEDVEDNAADNNPEEEIYEDYVGIPELHDVEPQHFLPRRAAGCLRKPYSRRNRELTAYEELRKKKLQLEVRKLEIEVREKTGSGGGLPQTVGESQAFERLRKRKLELEVRKLELDVWEHEEILGVEHSSLTNTIERAKNNNILHFGVSNNFGRENHNDGSVLIANSEVVEIQEHSNDSVIEDHNNGSMTSELSGSQVDILVDKIEMEDHNYGSVDVELSQMLKVNKRL